MRFAKELVVKINGEQFEIKKLKYTFVPIKFII